MKVTSKMVDAAIDVLLDEYGALISPKSVQAAIEAAIQAAWVSVDDAIPPPFCDVLVYRPRTSIAGIPTYEVSNHNCERFYGNRFPPSHWMPIPEYKGEQK
jgi:hypothetical protein